MREAQAHLQKVEEANWLLGGEVAIPQRQEKDNYVPAAYLFLRLPRGIETTADKKRRHELLYSFLPQSTGAGSFRLVELAFASAEQKDFAGDVLRIFSAEGRQRTKRKIQSGDRSIEFELVEFDDANGNHISVYIHKTVAVIYWITNGQKNNAARALQLSLESFGLGMTDQNKMREEYNGGSPWKPVQR
jgi:hypothetical protein